MGDFPAGAEAPGAPDTGLPGPDSGRDPDAGAFDLRPPPLDARPADPDLRPPRPDGDLDRDPDRGPSPPLDLGGRLDLGNGRDEGPEADATPACGEVERCNGLDDDCDGRVDEGDAPDGPSPCGSYVARNCRVWLGWAVASGGPGGNAERWGRCPGEGADMDGSARCFGTDGDGDFHALYLPEGLSALDEDHQLGLRFDCDADPVGAWVQSHCQVALAVRFHGGGGPEPSAVEPARCETDATVDSGRLACVRTGGDARFHRLRFDRQVRSSTRFAPAFFCTDPEDPQRAAATEQAVEIFLGLWALRDDQDDRCPRGNLVTETFGGCPGALIDDSGSQRCVGRVGGAAFATVAPRYDVDECDRFALALRPRADDR